ncbi:hypothetical protein CP973_03120 [Streptomyces albofaciens JCM 4342]|uniref:hypothetical protein n=1 Tax=Streptomyces albofaciens TaxID=66866 RepID=UPI00123887F2|nr:hypothetical protein [Streptomyces albofaciens]KAA6221096.1 hypothetical protein CP973_03120 [Streptomyces albofaciens JCM 4342]
MRKAAQIAGTAAVATLLLSGCGSSGSKDGAADRPSKAPAATPSQTAGGDKPAEGTSSLDGAWTARTGDSHLTLVIYRGTASMGLGADTGTACQGRVEQVGTTVIALKCMGGHTTRTLGTVTPGGDGKTLTVKWKGGPTDAFTKAEGKLKLPGMPGLPTGAPVS